MQRFITLWSAANALVLLNLDARAECELCAKDARAFNCRLCRACLEMIERVKKVVAQMEKGEKAR
jgi:hypothetical protein